MGESLLGDVTIHIAGGFIANVKACWFPAPMERKVFN
jgi:hypothetical protein